MKWHAAWLGACGALALVVAAGRVEAFPIVFDGPGGFGISASDAAEAEENGVPIISVASISTAAALHLTIPAPDVLSFSLNGNPSVSRPNRVTSEWSVTNAGTVDLSNTWLVFLKPVTYTPSLVGFQIDGSAGWSLISVVAGGTEYFYPARFLGGIDSADTVDFIMHHRVGQALESEGGKLVLPKYSVGGLQGLPVPEPQLLTLAGIGFALALALRRTSV